MKQCKKCGKAFEDDSNFCNVCGGLLVSVGICSNCGAMLDAESLFCRRCGTKVGSSGEVTVEEPVKQEPLVEPAVGVQSCQESSGVGGTNGAKAYISSNINYNPSPCGEFKSYTLRQHANKWWGRILGHIVNDPASGVPPVMPTAVANKTYTFYESGEETVTHLGGGGNLQRPFVLVTNKGNLYVGNSGTSGKVAKVPREKFQGVGDNSKDIKSLRSSIILTIVATLFMALVSFHMRRVYGFPQGGLWAGIAIVLAIVVGYFLHIKNLRYIICTDLLSLLIELAYCFNKIKFFSDRDGSTIGVFFYICILMVICTRISFYKKLAGGATFKSRTIFYTSVGTFAVDNQMYSVDEYNNFVSFMVNNGRYSGVDTLGSSTAYTSQMAGYVQPKSFGTQNRSSAPLIIGIVCGIAVIAGGLWLLFSLTHCKVKGCDSDIYEDGFCRDHYYQFKVGEYANEFADEFF